jgi:hypothetical protein
VSNDDRACIRDDVLQGLTKAERVRESLVDATDVVEVAHHDVSPSAVAEPGAGGRLGYPVDLERGAPRIALVCHPVAVVVTAVVAPLEAERDVHRPGSGDTEHLPSGISAKSGHFS